LFGLLPPPLELEGGAPPSLVPDELPVIAPLEPVPPPELLELDVSPGDPDDELPPELGVVSDPEEEEPPELPLAEPMPGVVTGS
jgi:hypothetical protein